MELGSHRELDSPLPHLFLNSCFSDGVFVTLLPTAVETSISGLHKLLGTGGVPTSLTLLFWRWLMVSQFGLSGSEHADELKHQVTSVLTPPPPPSPSLINLTVSVDVKYHGRRRRRKHRLACPSGLPCQARQFIAGRSPRTPPPHPPLFFLSSFSSLSYKF